MTLFSDSWDEGSLEEKLRPIPRGTTLEATFSRMSDWESQDDGQFDPVVTFPHPDDPSTTVNGTVVFSTNPKFGQRANRTRQTLIDSQESAGNVNVMILGGNGTHYDVVGSPQRPRSSIPFSAEEGLALLGEGDVYFARVIGMDNDTPMLHVYKIEDGAPVQKFGYLRPSRPPRRSDYDNDRLFAESRITSDLVYGSSHSDPLKPGDDVIVRHVATNPKGTVMFFEPVVAFDADYIARTPSGDTLETHVKGYNRGDIVVDVPVHEMVKGHHGDTLGRGHVPRPETEPGFYYKPILFQNVETAPTIVRRSRIINNGEKIILAQAAR